MGLLATLDTACLLTPRAWATSARERVVNISRMAAVRTAARSLACSLRASCSGPTGAHLVGNGVVTSGVLESSGRVPALAVEGGLGCLGNGRGFAVQLAQLAEVVGGERNLGRGIAISAGVRVAVVDADAVIAQARLQALGQVIETSPRYHSSALVFPSRS